ncbi:DUF1330 domain-containing protein [Paracoccus marcusii]|uniref:DUF1330 domain-containing protein n=1 Tax=Paracoccus marcusii TaxID=59779 RepID=A0ABY7UPB3_9RHOB|nr:DUF1330 domain-containing protein [Paracoccus marcusii]WDA11775.1 DUF1330 domain-containing protein [Paracoccus marcusii]
MQDYAAKVYDIAAKHGGRYLSRSGNFETLEGSATDETRIALIQFPDCASAHAFANEPEYAPFGKARQDGSVRHFQAIDDSNIAGAIPSLSKP